MRAARPPESLVLPAGRRAPAGARVYAVGDIHGRSDLLDRLHDAIRADARGRALERRVVVYLGDYIDRGGDSAGAIERLAARPLAGFEPYYLRGNHEAMMQGFLDGDSTGLDTWLWNGGMATLESYGLAPMAGTYGEDWADALRAELLRAMPPAHGDFLRALAGAHREGDLFFAHAGVRPGVALDSQSPDDLLWVRGEFLNSDADFGALVIHGHTVTPEPDVRANRIGIDTGAWRSGRLTAAVFEGDRVAFLTT